MTNINIDGSNCKVEVGERLIDIVNRIGEELPQVCYHHGKLRVRALVTGRVTGKELYMPMNSSESPVNLLTNSYTDAVTNPPAYKEVSVRMVVSLR